MFRYRKRLLKLPSTLKLRHSLLRIVLLFTLVGYAQQNVKDSLEKRISVLKTSADFSEKDTTYIDLLHKIGRSQRFYNSDSLLKYSQMALEFSQLADYKIGESYSLIGLGEYHSDKGSHKKAILYLQNALSTSKLTKDEELILVAKNKLAAEFDFKGDHAKSLIHYLEGIDMSIEYKHLLMQSIMTENVANLYSAQKDFDQALIFYKKVKKLNEEIGNEVISAETMSNMASLYADMGKLDYAMFNANSSITIFEKHRTLDWLAYAYEIKGKVYLKQDKFKWALYWYKQSEMLHENLDDERGRSDLLNGMAEAYLGLGKDSIATKYALEAFKTTKNIKFREGYQKCAKTLYKISKDANDHASALKYLEIYQTLSDTLHRNENKKSLTMLKTKMEHEAQKASLIEENEKQLVKQRNYVNASLAILFIFIVVTFLIRRNERIQRNLNKELTEKKEDLEKNEVELREINQTKDRLFSIVGHDLRGPIAAFQGLLKLFKDGEITQSEFIDFIPKLGHDIDHISFTLNNLLSWGQTQMNGATTKPTVVALESIVKDNINLLSEIAESKSIRLVSQLASNTLAWSDGNQIDIVIRNLISNALKFTPKNGMVTITSTEKSNKWQISVRDTGIGMSEETIGKIFNENANISTYGTNNEKGTGLGLSLCKEMVEKNKGEIWVESIPRKGSTFHFTLPKSKKNYQKTA